MFGRDSAVRRGRQTRDGAAVRRVQVMLDDAIGAWKQSGGEA